jgi:hypothetical protein
VTRSIRIFQLPDRLHPLTSLFFFKNAGIASLNFCGSPSVSGLLTFPSALIYFDVYLVSISDDHQ